MACDEVNGRYESKRRELRWVCVGKRREGTWDEEEGGEQRVE